MLEPSNRDIDGFKIQISPLPCTKSLEVLHRLGLCLSPSVAAMLGLLQGGQQIELSSLNLGELSVALVAFFRGCSWPDLKYFIDNLLAPALCNDAPLLKTMDITFQAKTLSLLRVLVFAIEVNYADFFDVASGALAQQALSPKTDSISKAA